MAAPDRSFAPPAHMLATAQVLPGPGVTAAPAGGQGFALDPGGTIPASLQSSPITGQVDSSGSITAGTGFTVNRSATGQYDVTFTTAFAATPTVLATAVDVAGRIIRVSTSSTTGFTVLAVNTSATAANESFNFVAFATV